MKQSKVEETKVEKTENGQVTAQTEEVKETSEVKTEITAAESGYRYTGTGENGKGNQSGNGACEGKKETQE